MATPAAKKRKLVVNIDGKVKEARLRKRQIRDLKAAFGEEGEKEWLVFPGLDSCRVRRPPLKFEYCGRKRYDEILVQVWDAETRVFLLTGPKGGGKSCILRALAVNMVQVFDRWAKNPAKSDIRLVCFWYLDAKQSLCEQVQDALLFTFCDDEEAVKQISTIESCEEAVVFLQERGEEIWLITDGEERLDFSSDPKDEKLRETARTWLAEISRQADFIIKALSPGATELHESVFQGSPTVYTLDCLLDEVERDALIQGTALGANLLAHPERYDIVDDIAGWHPLSLSLLISYCNRATGFTPKAANSRYRDFKNCTGPEVGYIGLAHSYVVVWEQKPDAAVAVGPGADPSAGSVAVPDRVIDETSWTQLVESFKRDAIFEQMRESVRKADIRQNEVASFRTLSANFPAYVAKGQFCTALIRRIYMEEASSKLLSKAYADEAWSNYVKERLRDERGLNWVELGWLCENFVSQVVQSKGLKLAEDVNQPAIKHFQDMQVIHLEGSEPATQETRNWTNGRSMLLLPDKYFFKHVDFVLLVKTNGVVHVYGGHRKTEKRFVKASNIKRWVADAACKVHYVYLCPTRAATSLMEVEKKKGNSGEDYVLHTTSFVECFEGVGAEEKELLKQLADKRKETMDRRKAAKKDAAVKRWGGMDPLVRRYVKRTDVVYLKSKGLVHGISFEGVTKEAMVKQLLEAKKMESCGINGEDCPSCVLLARQLKERKKPKL